MSAGNLTPEQMRLVAKLAWLYYVDGLNQPEIARRLNIAQARVSRLLKQAEEVGVVRTVVSMPGGVHIDIERKLEAKYGLLEAVVAQGTTDADIYRVLGATAATYLDATLVSDERVGISSWSASLLAAVEAMSPKSKPAASKLVQLLGGVGAPQAQVLATQMASRFASVLGAELVLFQAPGVVASKESRKVLLADPSLAASAAHWDNLTTAVVGIGSTEPSSLLVTSGNSLASSGLEDLKSHGAVGDVCLHYFDDAGSLVPKSNGEVVLGISPEQLRRIPRRIAIAGGVQKVAAIRGAIAGGWINVLVTDDQTAYSLLHQR
jgi:DNA-binding transcriptional regulator LsrR (DeoR family)